MEDWRKVHNEDLHNLYALQNIIRMIKVKEDKMGWASSMNSIEAECIYNISGKTRKKETTRKI
jgi:hypothetical protein